jgi:hypothetical protein
MDMLFQGVNGRTFFLSVVAILATVALFPALLRTLSLAYLERIGEAAMPATETVAPRRPARRLSRLVRWLFRSPEERGTFDFLRKLLARDRQVRLRLYPTLAYILLPALVLLLEGDRGGLYGWESALPAFLALFTLGMLPAVLLAYLPYSGESQGEWIFELAGFERPARVAAAIKKSLALYFFLPVAFAMGFFFSFFWGLAQAAAVVLFALLAGLLLLEVEFLLFFRGMPFARPIRAGRATAGLGYVFVALPIIGLIVGLVYFFLNTPGRLILGALILLPVVFLSHRIGNARYSPQVPQCSLS